MSLADIQIVKPVEPLVDTINPTRPFASPMMMTAERNRNQERRRRRQEDDLTNEKIDESNRAFPTPRSMLLLPLSRQIVVNSDEVNNARHNGIEMQVNKKEIR